MKIRIHYYLDGVCSDAYSDDYKAKRENYGYVGTIDAKDIDEAWALLQHLDHRKSAIPNKRSASVGDVFETEEDFFLIKWVGFKKLDWKKR